MRWLNRLWLVLIASAFALLLPIWVILMSERFGWRMVGGGIAAALFIRYHLNRRASCAQSSDRAVPPTEL